VFVSSQTQYFMMVVWKDAEEIFYEDVLREVRLLVSCQQQTFGTRLAEER
jgi:hypothetical protein